MPDLVGFEERPPYGVTKAEWEAQKPEEERNLPPPTKKDLLVKAKTGTGKTVVRQSYVVDPLHRSELTSGLVGFLGTCHRKASAFPGRGS